MAEWSWLPESQQMAIFASGPLTYLVFETICLHSSEELHSLGICYPAASQVSVHVPRTLWRNKATFSSSDLSVVAAWRSKMSNLKHVTDPELGRFKLREFYAEIR